MIARSSRPEVRNPILALDSFRRIREVDAEARVVLAALLRDLSRSAGAKAEAAWLRRKGPMAAYWRAVSTYAKHVARAVEPPKVRRTP